MTATELDHAIDVLARRQHGAFSWRQAVAAGATSRMAHTRVTRGTWLRLAPAVYALPSHPGTWHRALMAAVLGEQSAVVGGRSAAALHGLSGFRPGHPEIIVPPGANGRSRLATVHRSAHHRSTIVERIPVLTVCDTLFAVAGQLGSQPLGMVLDDAVASKAVTIAQLQARFLDLGASRRPGIAAMAGLLEARGAHGYVPPESVLEGSLYAILDRPGMPGYERQAMLPWAPAARVDARLLASPTLVEADGRRWHTRVADLARDHQRDRLAAAHGYLTLRFTYEEIRGDPGGVAADIMAVHKNWLASEERPALG